MKQIKSTTRSRLTDETLNNLMMITIEGPSMQGRNFEKIPDKWGNAKARHLRIV